MRRGWFGQSYLHALAARGVSTRRYAASKDRVQDKAEMIYRVNNMTDEQIRDRQKQIAATVAANEARVRSQIELKKKYGVTKENMLKEIDQMAASRPPADDAEDAKDNAVANRRLRDIVDEIYGDDK